MHFQSHPPKKVLIINTFGVGDVLFTTPLIRNLKLNFPELFIGFVCNERTAELLHSNTDVDRIFIYERDKFQKVYQASTITFVRRFWQFLKGIKNEHFDAVLDVSLSRGTGFLTWLIGIKHRIGYDYKKRCLFLNHRIPLAGYERKHVVEYYLSLLEELGGMVYSKNLELTLTRADERWAEEFLAGHRAPAGSISFIGMVPGGGASWGKESEFKRWPAEKFAKLADKLIEKFSAKIILMGDKSEMELCAQVSGMMAHPAIMACAQTNLHQCAALARKCSLMIVNDGGPLHLAVAAGARTVSIFGPVDEHVYGPYPKDSHVVIKKEIACRPCYRRFRRANCEHISCLSQLTVEEALERIESIS